MRPLLLLLLPIMCAAEHAVAGPYEEAKVAYQEGDYTTAQRLWVPLAEKDDPFARYNLGVMYRYGRGVPDYYVWHMCGSPSRWRASIKLKSTTAEWL